MEFYLPTPLFYTVVITNLLVMGTGAGALYSMIWERWDKLGGEKAIHLILLVGMLISFFVAMLLLIGAIDFGGKVVRPFG